MIRQQTLHGAGFVNGLRAVFAALIAVAFIGLVLVMAAFLTMAALIAAGVAALGLSAWWLYRKIRGRKSRSDDPNILVARRGPHGWTVDGEDQRRGA